MWEVFGLCLEIMETGWFPASYSLARATFGWSVRANSSLNISYGHGCTWACHALVPSVPRTSPSPPIKRTSGARGGWTGSSRWICFLRTGLSCSVFLFRSLGLGGLGCFTGPSGFKCQKSASDGTLQEDRTPRGRPQVTATSAVDEGGQTPKVGTSERFQWSQEGFPTLEWHGSTRTFASSCRKSCRMTRMFLQRSRLWQGMFGTCLAIPLDADLFNWPWSVAINSKQGTWQVSWRLTCKMPWCRHMPTMSCRPWAVDLTSSFWVPQIQKPAK